MNKDWYQTSLNLVSLLCDQEGVYSVEDAKRITSDALGAFHILFQEIIEDKGIRDTWDSPKAYIFRESTEIIEKSKKTKTTFSFGVGTGGYFIQSSLTYPEYIHRMKNDFWNYVTKLTKLGNAELHDQGRPINSGKSKVDKDLTKYNCSLVYQIVRDFILCRQCEDFNSGVGSICINIPLDSNRETIRRLFSDGIYCLHKVNYQLYRLYYIDMKRQEKKIEKETGLKVDLV